MMKYTQVDIVGSKPDSVVAPRKVILNGHLKSEKTIKTRIKQMGITLNKITSIKRV